MSFRVAIIGGGPGGLMTAYQLQQHCTLPFEATLYEASPRLGGKVLTSSFTHAPIQYEAGAAELYDYSHAGVDPLRELVERFGFQVKPMAGATVIMDNHVLESIEDAGDTYGEPTRKALADFDLRAKRWMSPAEFYESDASVANHDPRSQLTFDDELEQIPDEPARRFLQTLVHSDLATEPHRTSASYGLQNYLMNDPAYLTLYTIEGGIEQIVQELAARVTAHIRLNESVTSVTANGPASLEVTSQIAGHTHTETYDFVIAALPNNYLPAIRWRGPSLAAAIHHHHIHHDFPAHYLRVSVLFKQPFWRAHLKDSYVMLDAFGGCCLYDESSRHDSGSFGVLGWLLAGDAAMTAANHTDRELIAEVVQALPAFLGCTPDMVLEGHVHRWIGAVNGWPGGKTALDLDTRHIPDPTQPNLLVVGDYLFDSTLNGVLDSADYVAESVAQQMEQSALRHEHSTPANATR